MRAVVTGGAGFVGSHLVDALTGRGWHVVVIDDLSSGDLANLAGHTNDGAVTFVHQDIRAGVRVDGPVDLVFNLASAASPRHFTERPIEILEAGSIGMRNVIELAIGKRARLIQASTSEVYGEPQEHPQTETYWGNVNPIGTRSVYDESKRYAEALTAAHVRLGTLDAGIVRIFNTYGPRLAPADGRVVSNFIHQSLIGRPLTVYGSGEQTRSFCYVDDLVRGLLLLADRPHELGPVNLGNPEEITVLELAQEVLGLTGGRGPITHLPLPQDDPTRRRPDITRARDLLGWTPEITVRDGLIETIAWFHGALLGSAAGGHP